MRKYKVISQQEYKNGQFELVPIRHQDRFLIMKWRNEQIYHLRQAKPLNKEIQDYYFENVIAKLFEQEQPNQILFSFLKGKKCIGYGGLVHVNWKDKSAEVSFIMKTECEKRNFQEYWTVFLKLIEVVGFEELGFDYLRTYIFEPRDSLIKIIEDNGFKMVKRKKSEMQEKNKCDSIVIHEKTQ